MIPMNLFRSVSDRTPHRTLIRTPPEVAQLLSKQRVVPSKDQAGLVTFNEYDGNGRKLENIRACHAVVGDIDHGFSADKFEVGLAELRDVGASVIAYQTWTSKPEAERWRVLVLLDEPIAPDAYRECWHGLNSVFAGMLDENAKDAARLSYLPSHPAGETRAVRVIKGAGWEA